MKPTECTNFTNLFCHEALHISDSSSVDQQEFIHCTLSNVICRTGVWTAFEQDQDGTSSIMVLLEGCRDSYQYKFVKLVHLVGFIKKKFVTIRGHLNVKYKKHIC